MQNLTADNIVAIHEKVQSVFNVEIGIKDPGLLKSISERPDTMLYNTYEPFDDVFLKAASIMEGIIRMHPFIDGNKRTALLAVLTYLEVNGHKVMYPISAIRYTVEIAKNENNDPASTEQLIREIARWLEKHSAKGSFMASMKGIRYYLLPILGLAAIVFLGMRKSGLKKVSYWMAFDIYPEYQKEYEQVWRFFADMIIGKYSGLITKPQK